MNNGWLVAIILWILGGIYIVEVADNNTQIRCNGQHLKTGFKGSVFMAWPLLVSMKTIGIVPPDDPNYCQENTIPK